MFLDVTNIVQYECSCQKRCEALKTDSICKAPHLLAIHLLRYDLLDINLYEYLSCFPFSIVYLFCNIDLNM